MNSEKRELLRQGLHALAFAGCPLAVIGSLYFASFCLWQTAADPQRRTYWGLWSCGFVASALGCAGFWLWIVFSPWVRRAKERRRTAARLAAAVRDRRGRSV